MIMLRLFRGVIAANFLCSGFLFASAPDGSGLQGWWVTTANSSSFNPNSGYWNFAAGQYYYYFFPDGRVCRGLPVKGQTMENLDYARSLQQNPYSCGTYALSGNRITFHWRGSAVVPVPFARSRGAMTIAGDAYYPIAPANNLRLEGAFHNASRINTGRIAPTMAAQPRLTFGANGRFQGANLAGTYQISGYSILLAYSNGGRERLSFYRYPGQENTTIVIDGSVYVRER